jgi:DNA repair protein RadC
MSQSIVSPVEVYAPALLSKASALILVHNHPSQDPSPSSEDIAITRRLKECGDLLNLRVLDHIIIGETYLSFVERGLL